MVSGTACVGYPWPSAAVASAVAVPSGLLFSMSTRCCAPLVTLLHVAASPPAPRVAGAPPPAPTTGWARASPCEAAAPPPPPQASAAAPLSSQRESRAPSVPSSPAPPLAPTRPRLTVWRARAAWTLVAWGRLRLMAPVATAPPPGPVIRGLQRALACPSGLPPCGLRSSPCALRLPGALAVASSARATQASHPLCALPSDGACDDAQGATGAQEGTRGVTCLHSLLPRVAAPSGGHYPFACTASE
jgi:hypothetical protein